MGLWDKLKGEFIDIIEWTDSSNDTLVYRFERMGNEIKYGARLTVREGQAAVFINEGALADVFQPGMHTLETSNLPLLSTLMGWKHGFESPFKAEVYFVSTRRFTDQKWGTKNPIMMRDQDFGPVRIRAFGTYVLRVIEPATFIREVVGTDGHFTTDEITAQLRNTVVSRFSDATAESNIPVLDLASNYDELGEKIREKIQGEFADLGLELCTLLVENISLPPAVEEALDKRSSMGVIGNMQQYTQFQAANAMEQAAQNQGAAGGMAAGGMGMGLGFAMANQVGQALGPAAATPAAPVAPAPPAAAAPPPMPAATQYFAGIGGAQAGPFTLENVSVQIQSGQITRATVMWKQGMAAWLPAEQIPEVAALFAAAPPPMPPPMPPPA